MKEQNVVASFNFVLTTIPFINTRLLVPIILCSEIKKKKSRTFRNGDPHPELSFLSSFVDTNVEFV